MPELNHFRIYEIAQTETGEPLELAREGDQVACLGFDTARRRFVEIVALAGDDTDEFLERADRVGSLQHPSLARVVESGIEEKVAFYAVDLVDGESLAAFADRAKGIPIEAAVCWLRQIAEGIAVLDDEGLMAPVGSARLCIVGRGKIAARLGDFGIVDWAEGAGSREGTTGQALAHYLRALTNYQDPDEEPVYPPEVRPLSDSLEQKANAAACAELLADEDALAEVSDLGESLRPRLMLERLMFRRARPEHVMPSSMRPVRRAGEVSPYESIAEEEGGARRRLLVLPPERFVSERLLDVFEEPGVEEAIAAGPFWKHEDFRLLAEDWRPGGDLAAWIDVRPERTAGEVVSVLGAVHRTLGQLSAGGIKPRSLHPEDVLLEIGDEHAGEVERLFRDVPVAEWPPYRVRIRTHPTMRSLAGVIIDSIPEGAEDVFVAAAEGQPLNAGEVFIWYFNLRNRGLSYQAGELVESLYEAVGETIENDAAPIFVPAEPEVSERVEAPPSKDDSEEPAEEILSPIAAAMGIIGVEDGPQDELGEEGDEEGGRGFTNPIAQRIAGDPDDEILGDADEEVEAPQENPPLFTPQLEEDVEPDDGGVTPFTALAEDVEPMDDEPRDINAMLGGPTSRDPESASRGASILLLLMILLLSVAIAAAIAHISGRAFWQQ